MAHRSPDPSAALRLPADPTSVRQARAHVRERLQAWGLPDLVDDATLLVTELASNAVVHARSSYVVSAVRLDHAVRIAIRDEGGPDLSVRAGAFDDDALGGRGLLLVEALAATWGVCDHAAGRTVWAELTA